MTQVTDEFEITIGKDHSSGNLFAARQMRAGCFKEFESWHKDENPIDWSKVDKDILLSIDYNSLENWAFSELKVQPFKRYRFKVTVELIGEVPKDSIPLSNKSETDRQ